MPTQLLMYMPVIHAGYERLLERYPLTELLVLGTSFAADFPVIRKDRRALAPARAVEYVKAVHSIDAKVVEAGDLPEAVTAEILVVPNEALMRAIVGRYKLRQRAKVRYEDTFLRWDKNRSESYQDPEFDASVTVDELIAKHSKRALRLGERSSDWWRQVGAIAARGPKVLVEAYNEHRPTEYAPYIHGDPRDEFSQGVRIDLSTAMHAEAALVAEAARKGLSLKDADLYVSTFPCPNCAKLIAAAGFSRCYFVSGYAMLDGVDVLRAAGVQLVRVRLSNDDGSQLSFEDALHPPSEAPPVPVTPPASST